MPTSEQASPFFTTLRQMSSYDIWRFYISARNNTKHQKVNI